MRLGELFAYCRDCISWCVDRLTEDRLVKIGVIVLIITMIVALYK